MNIMNTLSLGQIALITTDATKNNGAIEIGILAKALGKQKGNMVRKLEGMFPEALLFKMRSKVIQVTGFGYKENTTYLLDRHTAMALVCAYDGLKGVAVMKALESAISGLKAAQAALLGDASREDVLSLLQESEREVEARLTDYRREYSLDKSENDTRSTALANLKRRGC